MFGSVFSAFADPSERTVLFLPSVGGSYDVETGGLSLGGSVKSFDFSQDRVVQFLSLELGYEFAPGIARHELSFIGPSLFGIVSPGAMLRFDAAGPSLWAVGEVDFFYFPFFFATVVMFERPVVVPSLYARVLTDFQDVEGRLGLRLSVPLGRD